MWFQFFVSGAYNLTVLSTSTTTYLGPSIFLFSSFSPTKFLLIGLQTSSSPFGYYQIKRIIMDYSDQVIMVSPVRKEVLNTLPIKKNLYVYFFSLSKNPRFQKLVDAQ